MNVHPHDYEAFSLLEKLADARHELEFERDRVGAPGSTIRLRAAFLLEVLEDYKNALEDYKNALACGCAVDMTEQNRATTSAAVTVPAPAPTDPAYLQALPSGDPVHFRREYMGTFMPADPAFELATGRKRCAQVPIHETEDQDLPSNPDGGQS